MAQTTLPTAVPVGWTDTHCHLDAAEFDADRDAVIARAHHAGVAHLVIPAVERGNFDTVRALAHRIPGAVYALGIHPLFVGRAHDTDLDALETALHAHQSDPKLVAVGEIGLDGFVPGLDIERQQRFLKRQLQLARRFGLPVILHVRKAQDLVLKHLRQTPPCSGIAHAFNGSQQQADAFLSLHCCLGFGGALTFERALQIRRLLCNTDPSGIVLETDAPDIPPHWAYRKRNEPAELPRIATVAAQLLATTPDALRALSHQNARRVLPRLGLHTNEPDSPTPVP